MQRGKRPPVFLMVQTACVRCGRDIPETVTAEMWDRNCSARCYHARELPTLLHAGG